MSRAHFWEPFGSISMSCQIGGRNYSETRDSKQHKLFTGVSLITSPETRKDIFSYCNNLTLNALWEHSYDISLRPMHVASPENYHP